MMTSEYLRQLDSICPYVLLDTLETKRKNNSIFVMSYRLYEVSTTNYDLFY